MTQTHAAYQSLRDAILSVDLRPGESVTERWLEGRLQASRTPVRAALLRLEAEGLVQRRGRGYVVTPIDINEIHQAFAFRAVVEAAVVRAAAERAAGLDLSAVKAVLDLGRVDDGELDPGAAFHIELARLSGNEFFVRAVQDVTTRLFRARWLELWSQDGHARGRAEHARIVELVAAGRGDEAAAEVLSHIHRSSERLLTTLRDERRGLAVRGIALRVDDAAAGASRRIA